MKVFVFSDETKASIIKVCIMVPIFIGWAFIHAYGEGLGWAWYDYILKPIFSLINLMYGIASNINWYYALLIPYCYWCAVKNTDDDYKDKDDPVSKP